jgi:hypothetical protein
MMMWRRRVALKMAGGRVKHLLGGSVISAEQWTFLPSGGALGERADNHLARTSSSFQLLRDFCELVSIRLGVRFCHLPESEQTANTPTRRHVPPSPDAAKPKAGLQVPKSGQFHAFFSGTPGQFPGASRLKTPWHGRCLRLLAWKIRLPTVRTKVAGKQSVKDGTYS